MKIGTRIISTFLIIYLFVVSLFSAMVGIIAADVIRQQARSYLISSNRARAEHIRTFIQDQKHTAEILAAASVYRDFLLEPQTSDQYAVIKEKIDKRLQRTLAVDLNILEASIINPAGITVASSTLSGLGSDELTNDYFIKGLKGAFFQDVYYMENGAVAYAVSAPVVDDADQVLGVSVLKYDPKLFYSIVKSENGLGDSEENFLINHDKYFITPSVFLGKSVILTKKVETANTKGCFDPNEMAYVSTNGYSGLSHSSANPQIVFAKDYRGVDVVGTHAYIPETGWCLITKIDKAQALKNTNVVAEINLLVGGAALLLFILFGYNVSRKISKPIEALRKGTDRITKGDDNVHVAMNTQDEIGDLSRSFDSLVGSLKSAKAEVDKKVQEQTEQIRKQNANLETKQMAILNVLDDVKGEEKRTLGEKKKYESLLESIGDGVVATDGGGNILFANKPAADMLGYDLDAIKNRKLVDVVKMVDDDGGEIVQSKRPVELVRQSLVRHRGEYNYLRKDGTPFPVSVTVAPVVVDGGLVGSIELFRDITEQRKNQQDLQIFQRAVAEASDHVVITDSDGIIVYMNGAAEKITGYSRAETLGKKGGPDRLWAGSMDEDFYNKFVNTIKGKRQSFTGVIKNKRKDGKEYDAAASVSPILDKRGNIQFFIEIERDVSKEMAIDRAKTEFVSLASHQLRTPLSAINWYTEMLLAGDAGKLKKEQRSFLEEIYHSNQRMVSLVNSLLNVSRLELGTFMVEPEKLDIREVAESVISELLPQIKKKDQIFTKKFGKQLPLMMLDKKLMRMVIQNLLTNAVKYTKEKGSISLTVDRTAEDLLLTVKDDGMGIPISQQSQIFKKLFRADNVREADTEGTGLGLYIVKAIVTQAGGKVWFESEENKGTTFYVSMPLAGMIKKTGTKSLA